MLWLEQLELRLFNRRPEPAEGGDLHLEQNAQRLLREIGAVSLARSIRVVWNNRLRSAAGRADFRKKLVSLNPHLREHGAEEIERTLRHELAHLLAHSRARRRRLAPHGPEWQRACADLGIPGEPRCHTLPFPIAHRARPFLYRCPRCRREFPRARRIRRALACLACCRAYNQGRYDKTAQLHLVSESKNR